MTGLEGALRGRLAVGGKAFLPYVTGGLPEVDVTLLHELAEAGADAIEVGIPFSDPVMDGPVIQDASRLALEAGATLEGVLDLVAAAAPATPVAVMTYLNPVLAIGEDAFLERAVTAGVAGVIVPDLPVDEGEEWTARCRARDVASVYLAAPGTGPDRLAAIGKASSGFVYCVSTYGVTGRRAALSETSRQVVEALRRLTDLPLLVGVGISTPEQAAEACSFADGVVVGSALMARLLDDDHDGALSLIRDFRAAVRESS